MMIISDTILCMIGEGNESENIGYPKLRAVLSFSESTITSGGFECVPGFTSHGPHHYLLQYCQSQVHKIPRSEVFSGYGWNPSDEELQTWMQ